MLCSMLDTCASCWMGWVKLRTYWIKAWISPMVMMPLAAKNAANDGDSHIAQVAHKFIMGCIRPERNWLFQADSNSLSLAALKSSSTAASRLKALMTLWPE